MKIQINYACNGKSKLILHALENFKALLLNECLMRSDRTKYKFKIDIIINA